ncbi:MAG: MBL fold metallo-hydrolase [Spirochaetes bacterium]|uniref:MBL fold metallo-hydrolase n=1 Tax=Candidatus Ornithospirochaeta stercoripullorum TaxID=2840899 RepID=A0A9D9H4F9_9SPIO|nr:MBL fold metallo-hydrolase [Candidatus Ornithospirochaeta stercoripullorum]
MFRITVLMENNLSRNKALRHGHGLSLLIDTGSDRILFDTGPDDSFLFNARKLGLSLDNLSAVVLSHGHYDHASGFRDFVEAKHCAPSLFVGKGFFSRKFAAKGRVYSDLSAGWGRRFAENHGFTVFELSADAQVVPGIYAIHGFPRLHREETIASEYVKESIAGFVHDDFSDEIALAIETKDGIVLVTGCAHPGIMNIADTASARYGAIKAVVGGIHLGNADDARAGQAVDYLYSLGVRELFLCHCSGEKCAERGSRIAAGDTLFFF